MIGLFHIYYQLYKPVSLIYYLAFICVVYFKSAIDEIAEIAS